MENVWWVKKHKQFLFGFCEHLSGSHFCRKDPGWYPKGPPKEWKWKMSDGWKNINDFYLNFANTCQDHTFAARIRMGPQGKAKGMKMENVWWVKKHRRLLFEFSEHLPGSHFCSKDPGWDPKGQPQDPKVKMSDWSKNRVKFVVNLIRSHQDITFPARTQDGTPGDNQRDLNWNCRAIEKPYHVFIDFYKVPSWHHFFHSDPGWEPKGQPKRRKLKIGGR